MTVKVVTDSAASLPAALAAERDIVVVPMQLEIAGSSLDERHVTMEELVARLDEEVHTSGPSPGSFADALESVDQSDGVVVLTVAGRMSSTYQSACTAARLLGDAKLRVIDTNTAAGAEGLVVLGTAELAQAGASIDDVEARARAIANKVRLVASVGSLHYLARGGRVPDIAARAGSRLGVHLLFEFRPNGVHPLRPSLGATSAVDQVIGHWRRSIVANAKLHLAVLHALREADAADLLQRVSAEVQPASSFIGTFGPVMVAHTGPDVIGLAWWWES